MGQIINEAVALIHDRIPKLSEIRVTKVCIGLGYTGVKLSTGKIGICHSLLEKEKSLDNCQIVKNAGSLAGSMAVDLLGFAQSLDTRERVD